MPEARFSLEMVLSIRNTKSQRWRQRWDMSDQEAVVSSFLSRRIIYHAPPSPRGKVAFKLAFVRCTCLGMSRFTNIWIQYCIIDAYNQNGIIDTGKSLKGASQAVRICGGKIAFSCLQKVNITQLFHLISHNQGRAF